MDGQGINSGSVVDLDFSVLAGPLCFPVTLAVNFRSFNIFFIYKQPTWRPETRCDVVAVE